MLVLGSIRQRQNKSLAEINAPVGDVLAADAEDMFETNPLMAIGRANELNAALLPEGSFDNAPVGIFGDPSLTPMASEELTAEQGRQKVAEAGIEGQLDVPERGIPSLALDILIQRKKDELRRQSVQARAPGGIGMAALRLGVGLGVSLTDPINVGLGFFPVVSGARYAAWLAGRGAVGRAAVRAGVGALEGAAGALAVEPLILGASALEQRDYGLMDSFLNVVFGTAIGGGLHSIGGAFGDWRAERGNPITHLPTEAKQVVLADAVGARIEGSPVKAAETLQALAKESPTVARVVERAQQQAAVIETERTAAAGGAGDALSDPRVAYWYQEVKRLRDLPAEPPKGESLVNFVKDRGGIRPDDMEGAEVKAVMQDAKVPPGFFSKAGKNADEIAEAAWEAGYIGRAGEDRPSVQELYDALGREARGERVFPAERAAEFEGNARQVADMERELADAGLTFGDDAVKIAKALAAKERAAQQPAHRGADESFTREWEDPEWVATSRDADEFAAAAPTAPDARLAKAEEELSLAEEELKALMDAGAIDEADARMMKAADEAVALARSYGKAAQEGAACMSRNGAGEA